MAHATEGENISLTDTGRLGGYGILFWGFGVLMDLIGSS